MLRILVKIALHGYFHRIHVHGKKNIPQGKPVILVANHQNALIDPLLLATHTRLRPYFLTRASVFKNPIAAKLLHFIRMLPVYRVRDGFSTIQQNQQTFEQTYEVLRKNGCVVIFAEGGHSLTRNLRPLSKGFTRMAFGLLEKYPGIQPLILPVGIDYSAHKRSGSWVNITFGTPIPVDMPPAQSGKLTKRVENDLRALVVNIPEKTYEETLHRILEHQVDVSSKAEVDYFLAHGQPKNPSAELSGLRNKVMKLFHLPLFGLWLLKKPGVKDEVFTATWKFLIGFCFAIPYYFFLLWLTMETPVGTWGLAFLLMAWIALWRNKNPEE
ncbi:lysophospholipid acyltransferase family protein [Algoriphagus confluentis]|uniref:lysophospholipid acyltransferase family protein n=1 Tax=Algoriphagus confluentis TaxID=1697556 RepID=UPI0030C73EB9